MDWLRHGNCLGLYRESGGMLDRIVAAGRSQAKEHQMAFEDVYIFPSGGKELLFRGELVAQAVNERESPPVSERWFELRVYRRNEGGFVPVIEYHTTFAGEPNLTIAEVVDRRHDVENFFYVFEPSETFDQTAFKAMSADDRQRRTKLLLAKYDALVNRVMLVVKERFADESDKVLNERKRPRLRRLFGLR